jgi:hypothetical protein
MVHLAKSLADREHRITIFAPKGRRLDYPNITIGTLDLEPFARTGAEYESS